MKLKLILLAACTLVCPALASAQAGTPAYPVKPVTFVVPAAVGGLTDVLVRAIGDEMARGMGQPIVIENKTGASGIVGTQAVARAAPDGYTLLITGSTPVVNVPLITEKLPYDVRRDLAFVGKLFAGQLLLTVNAKTVPATTMSGFVEWAERNKGTVSYGSHGNGTIGHLVGSSLSQSRKLDMVHVAYRGEAPMGQELIGGQLTWAVTSVGMALPHIRSGKLRALAVIGDRRVAELPEVPTMAQAGFSEPEFAMSSWVAMFAPAGTPQPVIDRLFKEARVAMQATPVRARMQVYAMAPAPTPGAEFRREYDTTIMPTFDRMLKAAGVPMQ
jgi:tripartite-type tricarboxylate transporter receptor subunit TctC